MKYLEIIDNLIKERGITRNTVAKEIEGLNHNSFNAWESRGTIPSGETLAKIAEYFNVSTDYLLGNEASPRKKGVKIPVLGRVAAGIPIEAVEDIIDWEEISEEMASQGEYFALQIKGKSMEPRIIEKDVVIVRRQSDIDSGDIAVVMINGCEAVCKKVLKDENGITLVSFNQVYAPKFYTNKEVELLPLEILGKVVELRGKF